MNNLLVSSLYLNHSESFNRNVGIHVHIRKRPVFVVSGF